MVKFPYLIAVLLLGTSLIGSSQDIARLPDFLFPENSIAPRDTSGISWLAAHRDTSQKIRVVGYIDAFEVPAMAKKRAAHIVSLLVKQGASAQAFVIEGRPGKYPAVHFDREVRLGKDLMKLKEGQTFTKQDIANMQRYRRRTFYQFTRMVQLEFLNE